MRGARRAISSCPSSLARRQSGESAKFKYSKIDCSPRSSYPAYPSPQVHSGGAAVPLISFPAEDGKGAGGVQPGECVDRQLTNNGVIGTGYPPHPVTFGAGQGGPMAPHSEYWQRKREERRCSVYMSPPSYAECAFGAGTVKVSDE